jgi:hypothetical protein
MTKDWRPVHGPRTISALVPVVAKAAFVKGGRAAAHLLEAWPEIVGPRLAEVTVPKRLSQGTLTIGCSGPVAMELQYLSVELIGRVNQYLGGQPITRLRFMQGPVNGTPAQPRPEPSAAVKSAAAEAVATLPPGPLRDALQGLGRAVLTESASRLGRHITTTS